MENFSVRPLAVICAAAMFAASATHAKPTGADPMVVMLEAVR